MDAKHKLLKVLNALTEIKKAIPEILLVDLLMGKDNQKIQELGYDETEAFGSGEGHDEDYWHNLIEMAIQKGYIKVKTVRAQNLTISIEGKRFIKKPTEFEIKEETDFTGDIKEDGIEELVNSALLEKKQEQKSSTRTKQQIKIIQAIDRKIALDDFAENEGIDIDDIFNELEELIHMQVHIDISYFTNEVLGKNDIEELTDFFKENKNDSIELALKEYGDVYKPEEIRLARIMYRSNHTL